jgi:hypothetical protein
MRAPVPDPKGTLRAAEMAGLIVLDQAGLERIGIGVT